MVKKIDLNFFFIKQQVTKQMNDSNTDIKIQILHTLHGFTI